MPADLDNLIRAQHGIISRRQALRQGLSDSGIQSRVARGEWWPVHHGVYLQRTHPRSAQSDVWAAILAVPRSVLSDVSACWWWAMTEHDPIPVFLTVAAARHVAPKRGVVILRRDLDPVDVTRYRSIPITAKPLSALTAAVTLGKKGPALLDRALQRWVSYDDVRAAHHRYLGSHGSARAGELVRAAGDRAAAESERLLIRLLKESGIGGWEVNVTMTLPDGRDYTPDFTFGASGVLVEVDGWAWHHTPDRFTRDRQRNNALTLLGWQVLHFTWDDLVHRPEKVIAEILRALRRAGRPA